MDSSHEGFPATDSALTLESVERAFMGLNGKLWRLAIVTGIAQFAMSIWTWQFAIFLQEAPVSLQPWQMGLTFSVGTLAAIIGYPLSGVVSDIVGRRITMALAFLPIFSGTLLLSLLPVWPMLLFSYALVLFGWSFILIISRAVPADELATHHGEDAPRKFMMVVMPAYLVDGLCPIAGGLLLKMGYNPVFLFQLAAMGSLVALLATLLFVRETLSSDNIRKARAQTVVSPRALGRDFWRFSMGMLGYYACWGLAIPYLGPLCVDEWGVDKITYGFTWSAFSLTTALLSYTASGLATRRTKPALIVGLIGNSLIIGAFSLGSGAVMMLLLNIIWATPVVFWIGGERTLIVRGVRPEMKGRSLGTFQFMMSMTTLIAAPMGALIWSFTGSLRTLWSIASVLGLVCVAFAGLAVRSIGPKGASSQDAKTGSSPLGTTEQVSY